MKFRQTFLAKGLLAAGMLVMAGCNSTSNARAPADHGDELETPDILLQDTSGKTARYGDRDFNLDPQARKHDQQTKLDPLEQDLSHSKTVTAQVTPAQETYAEKVEKVKSQPQVMTPQAQPSQTQVQPVSEPVAPVRQTATVSQPVKPAAPKKVESLGDKVERVIKSVDFGKEPSRSDSELEMPDPLLGEVDPA